MQKRKSCPPDVSFLRLGLPEGRDAMGGSVEDKEELSSSWVSLFCTLPLRLA